MVVVVIVVVIVVIVVVIIVIVAKVVVTKVAYIVNELYESSKKHWFYSKITKLMLFNRES